MGRFYKIQVGSTTYASQQNGRDDPGALNVEFDFFEYCYGVPGGDSGSSTLTIHGPSLQDLQQAQTYVGQRFSMAAGMSAGYPLAKPTQAGSILEGSVFQAFGNWIGTEMTLDFVVVPSVFTLAAPGNFVFNWQPGQSLEDALSQTFSAAYATVTPAPTPVYQLSGSYAPVATGVLTRYSTLRNLGAAVNSMTRAASPSGSGVQISFLNTANTLLVFDGAGSSSQPIQLDFTDLVGQPTWIDSNVMQFVTVLRADLSVGTAIKMPQGLQDAPGIVTVAASAYPAQLKYKTAFQGTFVIRAVRQIGNFRDPNGASWVTVVQAVPQAG